ncbi:MAG: RDD family protein [Pseudomonadota bacterium]
MPYALPDPLDRPEFFQFVPIKRALAWVIDMVITFVLALPFLLPLAVIGIILIFPLFLIPAVLGFVGFLYRWLTISSGSATFGMRFMAIELREADGAGLSGTTAFWHTAGTTFCFAVPPLQLISAAAMLLTDRGQGLPDMVLRTTMLNAPSR